MKKIILALKVKLFPPKTKMEFSIGIYTGKNPLEMAPYKRNPVLIREDVTDINAAYIADPFMIKIKDLWYMFFEVRHKGSYSLSLAYATSNDGFNWEYQKSIPTKNWFQSYPYVFEHRGDYYMVPENYPSKSIKIFKAKKFPEEWEEFSLVVKGRRFVDPSIVKYNGKWWIFASNTDNKDLYLFYADNLRGPWKEHPMSPIIRNDNSLARPGGRIIEYENSLYRFSQDCSNYYGERVFGFKIKKLTETEYEEEKIEKPILEKGLLGWNSKGMHTFDAHKLNKNQWIAAVDGYEIKNANNR